MELQLKNIGMIKEANVKIDGLTVIAGENDTGKSTAGKALFVILQSLISVKSAPEDIKNKNLFLVFINIFYQKIFKEHLGINQEIKLLTAKGMYTSLEFTEESFINMQNDNIRKSLLFIETPLVWNFTDFFRDIALIESQMEIEVDYPYLMKDLNFKLFIKKASEKEKEIESSNIEENVVSLMGGQFEKDEKGSYFFNKNGKRIELVNTATGIKYFGIFQVLSQNNYLNENTVLALDEPEVHLHPKWQLEMAKIIVELVKNGVKIIVNSHSPYMIEALERYGEKSEIDMDFYLAEDGIIDKVEDNNSATLSKIFEKLSAPFDVFDQMDSEKLRNG